MGDDYRYFLNVKSLWNPKGVAYGEAKSPLKSKIAYSNDLISVGIFDSIVGGEIFFDFVHLIIFFECEISLKSMISYREAKSPISNDLMLP